MLGHGEISGEGMDATFRDHNLLQTIALHQEFLIPFLSTKIVFFLDVDNRSVNTWDSLQAHQVKD